MTNNYSLFILLNLEFSAGDVQGCSLSIHLAILCTYCHLLDRCALPGSTTRLHLGAALSDTFRDCDPALAQAVLVNLLSGWGTSSLLASSLLAVR